MIKLSPILFVTLAFATSQGAKVEQEFKDFVSVVHMDYLHLKYLSLASANSRAEVRFDLEKTIKLIRKLENY